MACLVRQLFRIKIGKDVDPALIDDIMFPLLLTHRTQPEQLLQDIKLTRGPSDYVVKHGRRKESSLIILEPEEEDDDDQEPYPVPKNSTKTQITPQQLEQKDRDAFIVSQLCRKRTCWAEFVHPDCEDLSKVSKIDITVNEPRDTYSGPATMCQEFEQGGNYSRLYA